MRNFLHLLLAASIGLLAGARLPDAVRLLEDEAAAKLPVEATAAPPSGRNWKLLEHVPDGRAVPCPAASAVIFVAGQSNAANSVGQRFSAGPRVFWMYRGACFPAKGPLPGSEGRFGSIWAALGDRLVADKFAENVIFVGAAMGGTSITQWSDPAGLGGYLAQRLRQVPRITHVIWQQGESDFQLAPQDYAKSLQTVLLSIRANAPAAKIFVARGARCSPGSEGSRILEAQLAAVDPSTGIYPGPNYDSVAEYGDRYDDCHLSGLGATKLSALWARKFAEAQ